MRNHLLAGARRILAVRLDNIGDVIMLGPALRSIKFALPEAHLTLMASPGGSQAACLLPWVDEVLPWKALWQDVSGALALDPGREQRLVETLRSGQYDAALIFTSFSQSPYPPAYACYLAGIPVRAGQSKEFGGGVLSLEVKPPEDGGHQVDRNLHLVEAAGIPGTGPRMEVAVGAQVQRRVEGLLLEYGIYPGRPYILIAPGASCSARRYDPERFALVAEVLADLVDWPVVIAGSARESGTIAPVTAAVRPGKIVSLVGLTDVPEFAGLIERASLVLANNSAAVHLADALGRPILVLCSGTETKGQWKPRFAPHRLLRLKTDCSPCYRFKCPYNMECLDIPPGDVVRAALKLLERVESSQSIAVEQWASLYEGRA